jgi:DNA-binding NarL/FixJ family response regulator
MATQSNLELTETIIDAITGEETLIVLSKDQFTERVKRSSAQKAESDANSAARESALAKLADLGLTAEEIAAL